MTTIRKTDINQMSLELISHIDIKERSDNWVIGLDLKGNELRVDTSSPGELFEVSGDNIWSKAVINVLTNKDRLYKIEVIPYKNDLQASVAYARAVEQLNNPNVEFVSF